jgi:hypothetical protein
MCRFMTAVLQTADDFLAAGLFTAEEKDRVVSAAVRAREELKP